MGSLQPQALSFADTAPYQADAEAVVAAPASTVFAVLADHRRWPDWVGAGVTDVEPTSTPEHGVGSTRTVTFFRFAKVEERFVGWEEPTLWAFTGTSFRPGIFTKLVERFEVEPIDDQSCRITYRMGADFPRLLRPVARLIIRGFTRAAAPALVRIGTEAARRRAQAPGDA